MENTRLFQGHKGEGELWLLGISSDLATETVIVQSPWSFEFCNSLLFLLAAGPRTSVLKLGLVLTACDLILLDKYFSSYVPFRRSAR